MVKGNLIKRTTIILEDEERRYVESVIQEGKEPGIKPLIAKLLDIYRSMAIYDWKYPGEYYVGVSRVAFINVEMVDALLQLIPQEGWREAGRKMGEAVRVSMEAALNLKTTEQTSWPIILKRLRIQGFGDPYQRNDYIIVRAPLINSHVVWQGFLEALLGVQLEAKTTTPPYIFEAQTTTN